MTTRYGPSDRVRTCGLMVPNHPRYQLRHTRLYYFILYCYTYWISAFNPRRFPQKHSRATRDPEKACLFGERTRGVMNEFSPKAETNDMEQPRTMERLLRSLFLHLGAMPSSATGGGISPRPAAPHPESSSIIPQEKRFDKSFSKLF